MNKRSEITTVLQRRVVIDPLSNTPNFAIKLKETFIKLQQKCPEVSVGVVGKRGELSFLKSKKKDTKHIEKK